MTVRWEPVTDRSAWRPEDLKKDGSWHFRLTKEQVEELEGALKGVKVRGLAFGEITAEDFPLPSMAETLRDLLLEVRDGRGIATLRGVAYRASLRGPGEAVLGTVRASGDRGDPEQRDRADPLYHGR